eukprot:TRINITY_DN141_c0_g1_i4.p1 TRINITY_DN141_c0_g1~~TRINITY_DN141_c0_g1_i4.p1  ORF type:complete len:312 (+),score=86.38 TRINITY_DN141_c0_g1_i4:139-936(+)
MLRSLVGSEMCIRDRYQRRVRGKGTVIMSHHNAGESARIDEENKDGGNIQIGCVATDSQIICLYPPRNHGAAGDRAAQLMEQARKAFPASIELKARLWDSQRQQKLSCKSSPKGVSYYVLSQGENLLKPATCIDLVMKDFEKAYVSGGEPVRSLSYKAEFESTLKEHMQNPKTAKDKAYDARIKEVTALALENIELQLVRQDKIEYTEDLSSSLVKASENMAKSSKDLKNKYCWENAKCWIGIAVIVVIIIAVLVAAICVSTGCK